MSNNSWGIWEKAAQNPAESAQHGGSSLHTTRGNGPPMQFCSSIDEGIPIKVVRYGLLYWGFFEK